ncbi:hypothetical protein FB566_1463 [Stackebrandtia endophytica]|uniref:Uncharacterized protein n=1 Tax=Stackebrandtia endophytica TaxID=1496996 RepID=A0A543ATV7_9ACTN|nr:hypothetical protein [Stackebrandtia endophytica]TQL75945.1 hypothetical protein FB566_1463 [Stackebrandtia endophytica]
MEYGMLVPLVPLTLIAVLVWYAAITFWFADTEPAPRYDPVATLRAITDAWRFDPPEPRDWYGVRGDHRRRSDVQMARIVSRYGFDDQDLGPTLGLRAQLVGGEVVTVPSVVTSRSERATPGSLIPIGVRSTSDGDEWSVVEDVKPAHVRRLILSHRLAEGLIDDSAHAVASTGRHETVAVRQLTPTGRMRAGHIEVTIHFDASHGRRQMTGFLRPHEVAAVRLGGTASGYVDDEGRWALGPTWY